ncbi:hypothetical protein [Polaromonas sp. LjRoot131]|uniref:hypothetical protein n=1 Tax=Polaromonas sp. LjRoot131 TaxID=3342262 RepID=UPI003ECF4397
MKLTREQLYKWVWNCPVTRIAEELGVSGSGLGRKCKAYDVPTPGRGYWHQLALGKQMRCLPLPDPEKGSNPVSIKVSQERAAELDLLPVPFVELPAAPMASDDSRGGIGAPKIPEHIEASEVLVTSGFVSDIQSLQVSFAEQACESIADPADIMALATLHGQYESATRFIEALREAGQDCDAPTRAVLILWTGAARVFLSQSDPIAQVIKECRCVASGERNPGWWLSVQQR